MPIRILFLADSHLGIDTPVYTRVARRRRGEDFLANHRTALHAALQEEVDLVVHGGDVFDRSRVPASLAYQAYEPLIRIADRGIPVFIVPGNHERSRLPHVHLVRHRNIHIFEAPSSVVAEVRGCTVALSGFPYERRDVRANLPRLLEQTRWQDHASDIRLLCIHHCVEGATVGPQNFVFTSARDVVRHSDIPDAFNAVLSGHIHRHQALVRDLRGNPLRTPVLYPGSVERTAFAEMHERKGYMMLEMDGGGKVRWRFHELPARPMIREHIDGSQLTPAQLICSIESIIAAAPGDAVLTIDVAGDIDAGARRSFSATELRRMAPPTMNVDVRLDAMSVVRGRSSKARRTAPVPPQEQLQFVI